jgi:hypothetical protein
VVLVNEEDVTLRVSSIGGNSEETDTVFRWRVSGNLCDLRSPSDPELWWAVQDRLRQGGHFMGLGSHCVIAVDLARREADTDRRRMQTYLALETPTRERPHLYSATNAAYRELLRSKGEPQVVAFSGVRGSGKTLALLLAAQHLATIGNNHVDAPTRHRTFVGGDALPAPRSVSDKLLVSLEALRALGSYMGPEGLACSTCAVAVEVQFDSAYQVTGFDVAARLVGPARLGGDAARGYQALASLVLAPKSLKDSLQIRDSGWGLAHLGKWHDQSLNDPDQVLLDRAAWEVLGSALEAMDVPANRVTSFYGLLAASLLLGQVRFHHPPSSAKPVPTDEDLAVSIAALLGIDPQQLKGLLDGSEDNRHTLAWLVYRVAFDWFVATVSRSFRASAEQLSRITLLDCPGAVPEVDALLYEKFVAQRVAWLEAEGVDTSAVGIVPPPPRKADGGGESRDGASARTSLEGMARAISTCSSASHALNEGLAHTLAQFVQEHGKKKSTPLCAFYSARLAACSKPFLVHCIRSQAPDPASPPSLSRDLAPVPQFLKATVVAPQLLSHALLASVLALEARTFSQSFAVLEFLDRYRSILDSDLIGDDDRRSCLLILAQLLPPSEYWVTKRSVMLRRHAVAALETHEATASGFREEVLYVVHFRTRLQHWAALTIQRIWRGRVSARRSRIALLRRKISAIVIQRHVRAFLGRLAVKRLLRRLAHLPRAYIHGAAREIQRVWRGVASRKRTAQLARRTYAAIIIQEAFLSRHHRRVQAATALQLWWRKLLADRAFQWFERSVYSDSTLTDEQRRQRIEEMTRARYGSGRKRWDSLGREDRLPGLDGYDDDDNGGSGRVSSSGNTSGEGMRGLLEEVRSAAGGGVGVGVGGGGGTRPLLDVTRKPRKAVARRDMRRRLTMGDTSLRPYTTEQAYGQIETRIRERTKRRKFEIYYARLQARIRGPQVQDLRRAVAETAAATARSGRRALDTYHPEETFHPAISETSRRLAAGRPGTVGERALTFQREKEAKLEELRRKRDEAELREVRAPVISEKARAMTTLHSPYVKGQGFLLARQRAQEAQAKKREEEALKACTFRPEIGERSRALMADRPGMLQRLEKELALKKEHAEAKRREKEEAEQELLRLQGKPKISEASRRIMERRAQSAAPSSSVDSPTAASRARQSSASPAATKDPSRVAPNPHLTLSPAAGASRHNQSHNAELSREAALMRANLTSLATHTHTSPKARRPGKYDSPQYSQCHCFDEHPPFPSHVPARTSAVAMPTFQPASHNQVTERIVRSHQGSRAASAVSGSPPPSKQPSVAPHPHQRGLWSAWTGMVNGMKR